MVRNNHHEAVVVAEVMLVVDLDSLKVSALEKHVSINVNFILVHSYYVFLLKILGRDNKETEKNVGDEGANTNSDNRNFREGRGSKRNMSGPRYGNRSRGPRMYTNSDRGNSGPGGGNSSGFSQPIDTWFNPTAKESKKGNGVCLNIIV